MIPVHTFGKLVGVQVELYVQYDDARAPTAAGFYLRDVWQPSHARAYAAPIVGVIIGAYVGGLAEPTEYGFYPKADRTRIWCLCDFGEIGIHDVPIWGLKPVCHNAPTDWATWATLARAREDDKR